MKGAHRVLPRAWQHLLPPRRRVRSEPWAVRSNGLGKLLLRGRIIFTGDSVSLPEKTRAIPILGGGTSLAFVNHDCREKNRKSAMKSSLLPYRSSDAQLSKAGGKDGSIPRLTLALVPVGLALLALVVCGCSPSASRGDTKAGREITSLSPEQCLNGAVIQTSNDQQNYHIQP